MRLGISPGLSILNTAREIGQSMFMALRLRLRALRASFSDRTLVFASRPSIWMLKK